MERALGGPFAGWMPPGSWVAHPTVAGNTPNCASVTDSAVVHPHPRLEHSGTSSIASVCHPGIRASCPSASATNPALFARAPPRACLLRGPAQREAAHCAADSEHRALVLRFDVVLRARLLFPAPRSSREILRLVPCGRGSWPARRMCVDGYARRIRATFVLCAVGVTQT